MLGETTTVISVGEREALEVVEKARLHAEALTKLGSHWARPTSKSSTQVPLASGGRILALPSTSGGRSYSGNVILDEFAYHQHPEKVWDGAGGTVMHGFKLRVLSTPNGVGNLFHHLWSDESASRGYSKHRVTLDEALAQGLKVDMAECWKMARGDTRVFDQMFRCAFLDGEAQYLPTELINRAITDEEAPREGDTFAGLDVGRTADRTELIVVRYAAGVWWIIHRESRKRTQYEDLEALAALAIHTFKARRLCVDATGMGSFPAEQLQKRFGRFRVEPFVFTQQSKEELATTLYQRLVDESLRIPRAESKIREDLCAIRRIITTAGNVRYDAPQTEAGHADSAWSLALALHAGARPAGRKTELNEYGDDYE